MRTRFERSWAHLWNYLRRQIPPASEPMFVILPALGHGVLIVGIWKLEQFLSSSSGSASNTGVVR
jgi:hypothetical protein